MNILITGTSKGIGAALAMKYLEKGHKVFGISRSANAKLNANDNFTFLSLDLSDFKKVKEKLPPFIQQAGNMGLVILNAGILNEIKDLKDTPIEEIKNVMDVNVWVNKIIVDICFDMLEKVDQVVAISSGAAVSGSRGWNAYSLSKAALNMLIDLYAKEHTTTHFSAIAPGIIDTGMQDYISSLPDTLDYPAVKKLKKAKNTPDMPPPGEVSEKLVNAFEKALNYKSGSFLDVREFL
ncbi:MAG: SDR family NAD(P)-dependent oxidoreductase [Bacteroidetes bacterium]|nr:SDR family NAD(P)-dependent oxidoreductase [Bacteroidota bacterium]